MSYMFKGMTTNNRKDKQITKPRNEKTPTPKGS